MKVSINPGSGPVAGASLNNAIANMEAFVADLGLKDVRFDYHKKTGDGSDGRWGFLLVRGKRECRVAMPGLPLDRVRYTGDGSQLPGNFPRLYLDGGSWWWKYAVDLARPCLKKRIEKAVEALQKIKAKGCEDPYDAQKHAASGKDHCRGTCGPCIARDALEDLLPEDEVKIVVDLA